MKRINKMLIWAPIVVGIIAILFGFSIAFIISNNDAFYGNSNSYTGAISRLGTSKFGADFYTEIYEATAFSGNAISGIYHILCYSIGTFFMLAGVLDICYFIPKLPKKKENVNV